MCGFTGYISLTGFDGVDGAKATVQAMTDEMYLRGPDDSGTWLDAETGVALGHRRLSILDLSQHGHQPMHSHSERYVIVYNGEIYNFGDIKSELEEKGVSFTSQSDTETLLAAIEQWGAERALQKCNGMFAFALWDKKTRELHLGRDRFGQKPLYYGFVGNTFVFGSELKALRAHPDFAPKIERGILPAFLRHGYVPAPHSIFEGIKKLTPGTVLTLPLSRIQDRQLGEPKAYWSAQEVASAGLVNPFEGSDDEAVELLDQTLKTAVGRCMVSDVPLGAFLSGGIDSSAVVAQMQALSTRPVKTFSIGFWDPKYNEAKHAAEVAKHLGTDHTELYVTEQEALDVLPQLPSLYDEPFADSSQIPTFLVSKLARQDVTVSLSGDGGDELFCGYNRYLLTQKLTAFQNALPNVGLSGLSAMMTGVPVSTWDALARLVPARYRPPQVGDKVHKLAGVLNAQTPQDTYFRLTSLWQNAEQVVQGGTPLDYALRQSHTWPPMDGNQHQMMLMDALTYLPDDILTKVDRASMGVSLESRIPLLDHTVYDLAWRLPLDMKLKSGKGKWPLREVLYRYVPQSLIDRPKMGFGVPVGAWLRGELRDWAENLLTPTRIQNEGYFDGDAIQKTWTEHLSGQRSWQYQLWTVLMFQAWLDETGAS